MIDLTLPYEFEWDEGNIQKSYEKHQIEAKEAEELFLDENIFFIEDIKHSKSEDRYIAIGQSTKKKVVLAVFTIRGSKIRIISVRIANKKERSLYEEKV